MLSRPVATAWIALLLTGLPVSASAAIEITPCTDLPSGLSSLGPVADSEAFALAARASVVMAAYPSSGDPGRSIVRYARDGGEPQSIALAGRALALLAAEDGRSAFAIVRVSDRKGVVRSVDLVRLDLTTGRAAGGTTLPHSARGLAFGNGGATLLVAAADEIRTFQLPSLASGSLFRVLGANVGVVPLAGSTYVVVAQPAKIALANLAAAQGREGLELSSGIATPAPLRGLMASVGSSDPLAVAEAGETYCLRASAPVEPPPVVALAAAAPVVPADAPPAAPVDPPPAAAAKPPEVPPADAPPPVAPPEPEPEPQADPEPEPAPPAQRSVAGEAGSVAGELTGPARSDVASIAVLGPDNILREAARVNPDGQGRYTVSGLTPGAYRIVAAGKGGRVLICDPPFITVRVGSEGAVEAPVLKVLRAP